MPAMAGAWGFWPIGLLLAALSGCRLANRWRPEGPPADRLAAAATLAVAWPTLLVRLLAGFGVLSPWLFLAALGAPAIAGDPSPPKDAGRRIEPGTAAPLALGIAALGLAVAAAAWLPIWQWDSIGYHLPFVNFTLQAGSLAGVPRDAPYLGSYPHAIELIFLAERMLLPDDRLLDLGQIPLALAGAAALAALARREGASRATSIAAGALWIALPAVFLQMPSNYVDVGSAAYLLLAIYWVSSPPDPAAVLLAGLALGLYLGSKANAPIAVAVLGGWLAVRAARAGRGAAILGAAFVALATGGESYVRNLLVHRNPIWPVALALGRLKLPGEHTLPELLAAGANAPHLTGPLPLRLLRSWTALLPPHPMVDMRIGGFGPLFLLVLPAGMLGLWRRRRRLAAPILATLCTADPAIARYTLAFPAAMLALAAAEAAALSTRARAWALRAVALGGAVGLAVSVPGLTGGGPPLLGFARLSPEARLRGLGPDGPPGRLIDLRRSIGAGEAIAYGEAFDLAYLLWKPDGSNRVLRVPRRLTRAVLDGWISEQRVRLLLAGAGEQADRLARAAPARFNPEGPCGGSEPSCRVYRVVW